MHDNVKDFAANLRQQLAKKGIKVALSQSLEISAQLLGSRDWQALKAAQSARQDENRLRPALHTALSAMARLADNADGAPEWREGGFAHEARQTVRQALAQTSASRQPQNGQTPEAAQTPGVVQTPEWLRFLNDVASTPLNGEFSMESNGGMQKWQDAQTIYELVESWVHRARDIRDPKAAKAYSALCAKVDALENSPAVQRVLHKLVNDLGESYSCSVCNTLSQDGDREPVRQAWKQEIYRIQGAGPRAQIRFLLMGFSVQLLEEALEVPRGG